MAITYPIALPATPGFRRLTLGATTHAAMTASPFTAEQQVFLHEGEFWRAEASLPPMTRAQAEAWVAALLSLRGIYGTFSLGDSAGTAPRGTAAGNPGSVDGASQTGLSLNTLAWTASESGLLLPGDWIQIAKNYLTNPRAFDQSNWTKSQCTVTATNITAPNGVAEAERATPDGGATNAVIYQTASPAPSRLAGEIFTGSVWLKAASGTPSIYINIADGTGFTLQSCALTTNWQPFSVQRTLAVGATFARFQIGGSDTWPVGDGAIDMWGAALYAPSLDAYLHKVLVSTDSDANTKATLEIRNRLRESPPDFSAVITSSAKGLFRLADNEQQWDIDEAKNFGLGLSAIEAL